jgi:hypothetical protein
VVNLALALAGNGAAVGLYDADLYGPNVPVLLGVPSRVRVDRVIKFTAYEAAGVRECWIANPRTRTVEVYVLENGEYGLLGEFAGEEPIQSLVVEGIVIVADTL